MTERGAILAVDDEVQLLGLMEAYLTRLGYRVSCCASSAEALQRFRETPRGYAAVLVDLHMPGMPGQDLVASLREIDPDVRLVILSGYPGLWDELPEDPARRTRFLQKPFSPAQLAGAIDAVLAV